MHETRKILAHARRFVIAGVAVLCLAGCRKEPAGTAAAAAKSAGRTVVFDSMSKSVNPAALEAMRWQDIAPTTESCARHRLTAETLKVSAGTASLPVIYLRGLLKFTLADLPGAEAEWATLDVSAIPADHLYAPWRLATSGKGENRYEKPLADAVAENRASPLVCARFLASHGRWRDALDAYLLTDPSNWSTFEIKTFAAMKMQAPCSRDISVLMAGALSGGNVPQSLRRDLARLIKGTPLPDKEAFEASLRSDPALAKAAVDGAARALSLQQAFASNRFEEVLSQSRSADPLQATDQAALLTFLSAVQMKDAAATETWAGELLRRDPTDRNRQWIASIRTGAP